MNHATLTAAIDHGHALRLQVLLNRIGDLLGQLLLNLQTLGVDVDDASQLAQPDHAPIGNVSHVRLADKRQEVMLAHRVKLDVFDEHDLARFGFEDRIVDQVIEALPIAGSQKFKGARGPCRRRHRRAAGGGPHLG